MNKYKNFEEAGNSNWELLITLFGANKCLEPKSEYSYWDGLVKKDNVFYITEVKRRQFDDETLRNKYGGEFFLEKKKFDHLHEEKIKWETKYKDFIFKIWYISETSCGLSYVFDLTDGDYEWVERRMKTATYRNNDKSMKQITYLNVADAVEMLFSK